MAGGVSPTGCLWSDFSAETLQVRSNPVLVFWKINSTNLGRYGLNTKIKVRAPVAAHSTAFLEFRDYEQIQRFVEACESK